jgi:hypothetical protein
MSLLPVLRVCDTIECVKISRVSTQQAILFVGDMTVFIFGTLVGFASHDSLGTSGWRLLTTLLPVIIAWLLIAPYLGVYDRKIVVTIRQIWRPFWAMVLAAPMAAFLRGAWLGSPIIPIFVVVIGGVNAIFILGWRIFYLFLWTKRGLVDG